MTTRARRRREAERFIRDRMKIEGDCDVCHGERITPVRWPGEPDDNIAVMTVIVGNDALVSPEPPAAEYPCPKCRRQVRVFMADVRLVAD